MLKPSSLRSNDYTHTHTHTHTHTLAVCNDNDLRSIHLSLSIIIKERAFAFRRALCRGFDDIIMLFQEVSFSII